MRLISCLIISLVFFFTFRNYKNMQLFYIANYYNKVLSVLSTGKKGLLVCTDYLGKHIGERHLAGALYPGYGGFGMSGGA